MVKQPLLRAPFVLLFLIMLANASYASMGDISICFPFFLLLALLMAGMIAQGRSPLVGFDISISKPPAQIKSTSYHFKSFSSGGYDSAAKLRDQLGGGNYLTRGFGWVANKMAKGTATVVSKATKGKFGSKVAKEGVGKLKTMADRGALYALTGGKRGGGYQGSLERDKSKMEKQLKTLKDTLIKLRGSKFSQKNAREIENLSQRIGDLEKRITVQDQLIRQTEQARQRVAKMAGIIGKIKMLGYVPALAAGGSYLGAKHTVGLGRKYFERLRTRGKLKTLEKLRAKKADPNAKFTKKDERRLKDLKRQEGKLRNDLTRLSERGPIARIFNPEGLSKKQIVGRTLKLWFLSGATGFLSSFSQNLPYHVIRNVLYERLRFRPDLSARAQFAEQTEERIKEKLNQLTNPTLTPSQKVRLLRDIRELQNNLIDRMVGGKFTRLSRAIRDRTKSRTAAGEAGNIKKLERDLTKLNNEAVKLARTGKTKEFLNKVAEISDKFKTIDKTLFARELRYRIGEIDEKIKGLDKRIEKLGEKFNKGEISKDEYGKKIKKLTENREQLLKGKRELIKEAKTPATIMGDVLRGKSEKETVMYAEDRLRKLRAQEEKLKKDKKNLQEEYKAGKISKEEYGKKLAGIEKQLREIKAERKKEPLYRRMKETHEWQTTGKFLTPEATRESWLAIERLTDFWHEKEKASQGRKTPEALATKGVAKSLDGILEMQRFRQVISELENIVGPSVALLSQEESKRAHLARLLGQYQLDLEKKKSKKIFEEKTLYEKRSELEEECRRLREELKNLKANTKEYREKENALRVAQEKLNNVNLLIRDAEKELAKTERTIRIILTHFTLKDALLAQRQLDAFRKGEDEVKKDLELKIGEVEKKLRRDSQTRRNIENEMRILENRGEIDTRKYRGLEKKLRNLESSIEKKERERDELSLSFTKRYQDLQRAVEQTAARTEIKVGGDRILRDRDIVLSEMSMLRAGMLEKPNSYTLSLMKTLGVAGRDEIERYRNISNLQGEEKERVKSEYEKALRNTVAKLKRKWDNVETINLAQWTRKRMEETGDSLGGQETGVYRDLIELDAVIDKLEKDRKLKGEGKEMGKYLKRKEKVISDMLYLTTLEYGQVLDAGVMKKYVDTYHEIEKIRKSNPKAAEFELKEIEMRLNAVQGEIKEAEELGWTKKVEVLREHERKLLSDRDRLNTTLQTASQIPKEEVDREYELLKRKEQKLIRFTNVMHAAELLQREEDKGFMQPATAERLKITRADYAEDSVRGRRFWDEARWWAGQLDRNISENALAKYEATALHIRNEIKGISAEINEIENKLKKKGDKTDVEKVELKNQLRDKIEERREKQKELRRVCTDWKEFKDTYGAIYAPLGRAETWMGPGSETRIAQFIEDYAEKDIRNRLGIFRYLPERLTGLSSSGYEKGSKFLTKRGGAVILATTVLAPFTIPFVGAGVALALTTGAMGAYGAKTTLRKFEEWKVKGYPYFWWGEEYKTRRVMSDLMQWGPVFTGRGSGGYLMTMRQIWESQLSGAAYLSKGLRLDEYGNVRPDYEGYRVPSVGMPFYMAALKGFYENPLTTDSYFLKKISVATMLPGGWDELRLVLAENPRVPSEIKKSIQYQMVQFYGSTLPLPYSKQAREMLRFGELSRTVAFYEPAKDVIPVKQSFFDPLGLHYGLSSRSFSNVRGYVSVERAMEKLRDRQITGASYNALDRAQRRFGA